MRIKRLIAVCLFCFGIHAGYGQEAVSSGGGFYENADGTASVTIGETVTETFESGNTILTQGMQQPTLTLGPTQSFAQEMGINISVYPNPTSEHIQIETDNNESTQYVLTTLAGQVIISGSFDGSIELEMQEYPVGSYTLSVSQQQKTKSLEIIKH